MTTPQRQLAQYLARELRESQTYPVDLHHEFRADRPIAAMTAAADLLDQLAYDATIEDASRIEDAQYDEY